MEETAPLPSSTASPTPPASPSESAGPAEARPAAGVGYEFDDAQNRVIGDLALSMRVVAWLTIALGAVAFVDALVLIGRWLLPVALGPLAQAIAWLAVGFWLLRGARGFRRVVDTQGNDIPNLMSALTELMRVFRLWRYFILIGALFAIIGLVVQALAR